jgi:competence protein ComEC
MKRPLTGLAVAFASGIWLGSLAPLRLEWLCCGAVGLLAAFFVLYRTRSSLPALFGAVLVTGMLSYRQATTAFSPNHVTRLVTRHDQNIGFRGLIVSGIAGSTSHAEKTQGERQRFTLQLTAIQIATNWIPAEGRVLVFVDDRGVGTANPLQYGDRIECTALMRVPTPARNPGAFDWPTYLRQRNIAFTAAIRKTDVCTVLARNQANPFIALSLRMQERFERALRYGLENEPELAGVLVGMVIGERSDIPTDTYEDFQLTGVFHVFAINGLHVGLVTAILLVVLRLVRIPRRWCGLVGVPLLALYVFATGAHPGAVRALVMASVWMLSWMLVRPTNGLNNLAAAALALLVWEPTQLFDGGFLLSFTVVAAIVVLTPRFEAPLNRWVAPDPFLPRRFVSRRRRAAESVARHGVRLLSCSLAAWVGLVPLLAVYFHLFTPVSIVANLLVIPLLTAIISLGLMATMAHAVWPWLTLTLNNANLLLLAIMTRGVGWLSEIQCGHWFVQAPPAWLVLAYYALGLVLLSRWIPWRWRLATLATGVVLGGALAVAGLLRDTVELTVLSLNDGPAIFLNAPGERNDWLIDGGGDWDGARVLPAFLRAQGVDQLGAVVLTRGIESHAGGLSAVLGEIPVAQALYADASSRSKSTRQWLATVNERRIPLRTLRAGDTLSAGNHVRVQVLHPPPGAISARSDDNALVLAIEVGATRVLLMSDTGETVERRLLESGADVRAAVIVRGQHEKESCCSPEFLAAARPEVVVLTVNARSNGREPEPAFRKRLEEYGVKLLRTDETGAVTILLTGRGYQLRTHWPRHECRDWPSDSDSES